MNSFNTHDDTQKVPDPYLFLLLFLLSLLDFTCIVTPVAVQLRLLRSTQTQILRFTPLIRFVILLCDRFLLISASENVKQQICLFPFGITQSQYPRLVADDFVPMPSKGHTDKDGWYSFKFLYFTI
jgi:hypothetical protein